MTFTYNGVVGLARNPKQESLIILEAADEKEAARKLKKYIGVGIRLGCYSRNKP